MIDKSPKIDMKMYEANIRLLDENKILKYELDMLSKKIEQIKSLCKTIDKERKDMKPYTSRIIFIIENNVIDE